MTVAQVGDTGAAQLAKRGERPGVGRAAQNSVDPVAGPLQRDAMVRCTQKYDVFQVTRPA